MTFLLGLPVAGITRRAHHAGQVLLCSSLSFNVFQIGVLMAVFKDGSKELIFFLSRGKSGSEPSLETAFPLP